jgi:hypothetical protein
VPPPPSPSAELAAAMGRALDGMVQVMNDYARHVAAALNAAGLAVVGGGGVRSGRGDPTGDPPLGGGDG